MAVVPAPEPRWSDDALALMYKPRRPKVAVHIKGEPSKALAKALREVAEATASKLQRRP